MSVSHAIYNTHIAKPSQNMKSVQFHHDNDTTQQMQPSSQIVDTGPSFVPSQAKIIVALIIREGKNQTKLY